MSYQSETDSDLEFYLKDMGIKDPLFNTTAVRELLYQAGREASESEVGQQLAELLVSIGKPPDFLSQRVSSEIARRFGSAKVMPGVPTVARTIEVYGDLYLELKHLAPKPAAFVPKAPTPKSDPAAGKAEADLVKELHKIAHALNFMMANLPSSALTPKMGVMKLTHDGKQFYDYDLATYEKYVAEIVARRISTIFPLQTTIQRSY